MTLTPAQAQAIDALAAALAGGFASFLLQGITGIGQDRGLPARDRGGAGGRARRAGAGAGDRADAAARGAVSRAASATTSPCCTAALPPRERLAAWRRLRAGEVGIALGARSAVFAPVRALGVVVVDEEHDPSFKQEEGVRYHARDLAVVRAQRAGALAILGTATPSLESTYNVARGRFTRLVLPERATPRPLPAVTVVDLRRHPPGPDGLLSAPLVRGAGRGAGGGRADHPVPQPARLLHRAAVPRVRPRRPLPELRGVDDLPPRARSRLVCHYCGRIQHVPERCPSCSSTRLERMGIGTEQRRGDRARALSRRARRASGSRHRRRAAAAGSGLDAILARMHAGEIDVLVGTQMVTKGHDFPGVTLVGVLKPDRR